VFSSEHKTSPLFVHSRGGDKGTKAKRSGGGATEEPADRAQPSKGVFLLKSRGRPISIVNQVKNKKRPKGKKNKRKGEKTKVKKKKSGEKQANVFVATKGKILVWRG